MAKTPTLLHGTMEVTIKFLHNSPNKTPAIWVQWMTYVVGWLWKLLEWLVGDKSTELDANIYLDGFKVGSKHIQASMDLSWKEYFYFHCAHMASNIKLAIKDVTKEVSVQDFLQNDCQWVLQLQGLIGAAGSETRVVLKFVDARKHSEGIDSDFEGVGYTHYPQRNGCKVTLYQDAHIADDFVQRMGNQVLRRCCWEDIFDAINKAKKFIYIAGWSLETDITLIRDTNSILRDEINTKLGELLKKKAQEPQDVKVLLLLWKDRTNISSGSGGHMKTFCEKTQSYFQDKGVHCVLCPRPLRSGYSHHQKIVVVDSDFPGDNNRRRIVSFIGGFDLSHGRYDTPTHSLFRTLNAEHSQDFHQPCFPGSSIEKGGPREPWHDVHCKLEGPVVKDVYDTFVERCMKEGIKEPTLFPKQEFENVIDHSWDVKDADMWNVQLFRSVDDSTTCGLSNTPEDVSSEGKIIDRSIQDAYIGAIRRAKRFIYIENQYFMGSGFDWSEIDDDCSNLIPNELSYKIVSKIQNNERFVVYVVIPMWPEGQLDGIFGEVQNMLDFQRRTIEMMYKRIVQALEEKEKEKGNEVDNQKIKEEARKYLSFFCLGNREVNKGGEYVPPQRPTPGSHYHKAQDARRFMIYVHSKMMIVDDEYIIVGSANINQRSMDGGRDTEIAMGAYQPHHLATSKDGARGQIHGFRMSLWYEHLGMLEDTFLYPEREECVNRVNHLAENTWNSYSEEWSEKPNDDLPRHLLRYPFDISDDGTLTNLSGFEFFPDTTAPILGKHNSTLMSHFVPDRLQ